MRLESIFVETRKVPETLTTLLPGQSSILKLARLIWGFRYHVTYIEY